MNEIIPQLKKNKILIFILLLGSILRFYHVDFQSGWLDELHTINESNPSFTFAEVYKAVFNGEQMPVLYFYIIYFLFKIFGYSVFVARMFSVVLGIVSIYTTYLLGKELLNKKVGMVSALLIAVNFFHISYSQEARPYIFLYLFTTLSFYYLIKFIKISNFRNAFLYGLFTGLMLYGHFFAIFSIFAQYLFLLFILFLTASKDRKQLLIGIVLSGFTVLMLHIPSIKILLNISKITSFWVQKPTLEIYTSIFKGFFGNSEMVLFLITVVTIYYFFINFLNPTQAVSENSQKDDLLQDKLKFSFLLFSFWAVVTLLLPLIRSYLTVPMIVDRYFITLLPLSIFVVAMGIEKIKANYIQKVLLLLIVIFSITDIVAVKKYYFAKSKSEFREISKLVESNKSSDEKVYSSLSWYYSFYLNKDYLIENTLDDAVKLMSNDPKKAASFWYVDGHVNSFKVTDQTQIFLDTYFDLEQNIELYGAWAKHYVLKSANKSVDVLKFGVLNENKGDTIIYGIDEFQFTERGLTLKGWATLEEQDANYSKINIVLISEDNKTVKLSSQQIVRNDVTIAYKSAYNYDNSGFIVEIPKENIPNGNYNIGIVVNNSNLNKHGFILLNQKVEK